MGRNDAAVKLHSNMGRLAGIATLFWALSTLLPASTIWWMNPAWFEKLAFWMPPLYEPYAELVEDPNATQGIAVHVWDDNRWNKFPSVVDPLKKRVTAEISYSSLFTSLVTVPIGVQVATWVAIGLGSVTYAAYKLGPRFEAALKSLGMDSVLPTDHFMIYYDTDGDNAVPRNLGVKPRKKNTQAPDIVTFVGDKMEKAYRHLSSVKMKMPRNLFLLIMIRRHPLS